MLSSLPARLSRTSLANGLIVSVQAPEGHRRHGGGQPGQRGRGRAA